VTLSLHTTKDTSACSPYSSERIKRKK
jgi:hypothetical protein